MKFFMSKEALFAVLYSAVILAGLTRVYFSKTVSVFSLSANKKVIMLDAGHGAWDTGKQGLSETIEKDINLSVAEKLQAYLEASGAFVVTTRADDSALGATKREDLKTRKDMANELKADIFLSIHQNSFPQSGARGAQVFYHGKSAESERLAVTLQEALRTELDPENRREAKANFDYYLLKNADIPAVIIECGFLSNPEDALNLSREEYQSKVAWAIYAGIIKYFGGEGR